MTSKLKSDIRLDISGKRAERWDFFEAVVYQIVNMKWNKGYPT